MEIALAEERMLRLVEEFSPDEALARVEEAKVAAFGTMSRLLLRPKPEDIALTYRELRYEPFWHIRCRTHYIYDRSVTYTVPVTGPEVQAVTISEIRYEVRGAEGPAIEVPAMEHCEQEQLLERFLDAVSGEERPWGKYLDYTAEEVTDPRSFPPEGTLALFPQIRASFVVRQALRDFLQPIQADVLHEEKVAVERIDLYYRPVYAFEYTWESRRRRTVLELDGLTGEIHTGGRAIRETLQKVLSSELLFDIGVDAVDLLVPGGGIALKLAKAAVTRYRKE